MKFKREMPHVWIIAFLVTLTLQLQAQSLEEIESHRISLPNGWHLTPAGKMVQLGDLPLNIAVSPSLSPDHKTLYSSCWGCDRIIVFDTVWDQVNKEK